MTSLKNYNSDIYEYKIEIRQQNSNPINLSATHEINHENFRLIYISQEKPIKKQEKSRIYIATKASENDKKKTRKPSGSGSKQHNHMGQKSGIKTNENATRPASAGGTKAW